MDIAVCGTQGYSIVVSGDGDDITMTYPGSDTCGACDAQGCMLSVSTRSVGCGGWAIHILGACADGPEEGSCLWMDYRVKYRDRHGDLWSTLDSVGREDDAGVRSWTMTTLEVFSPSVIRVKWTTELYLTNDRTGASLELQVVAVVCTSGASAYRYIPC
jgi:hypothetical protein